ncbi:phage head closure protein [Mesorhizobium sp. B2-1-3A]|uniref:phage head closure protein n=1 Tax=Mesorhizobium sp. B2-1-3A TaxID=2589971 RepID=UPI00112C99C4|nr:phage head closure protein [Mesorhizobium sp. B2-1-3A]TPM92725.1 head-tail adaptor protein [Mesorhizobium sp. B2-1-3A]
MAMPDSAGALKEKVAFDLRGTGSDGGGGVTNAWQEQFSCRAGFVHRTSGESVMADRLQGKHTLVVRVRSSSHSRVVTTAWRVRDVRKGTHFNIIDVTETVDRKWVDILAQSGGPNG